MPIWISGGQLGCFFVGKGFVALVGLAVDLHVVEGTIWLDPFV